MLGGDAEPCVSFDFIRSIQARTGELCPRVELWPENAVPAELALAAIRVGMDSVLWRHLFELHGEGVSARERLELLYLVARACADPVVVALVKRARER